MLNSDKLVFVELQKTGSTGLKKFLGGIVGGESTKSANYAGELLALGKPVVGLVCHPLSWYLDQWRLGCAGKGDLYKRLTDDKRWDLLRSRRTNRTPRKDGTGGRRAIPDNWGAAHAKAVWYADENNAEAFREWLVAVAGSRGIHNVLDHSYQVSPVSRLAGLMTYHFVIRFVREGENLERSVDSLDALRAAIDEHLITRHFVRVEHAGEDLPAVFAAAGVALTPEQQAQVAEHKRRGADKKLVREFYDADSLALVAKREALLFERFGYDLPARKGKPGKQQAADQAGEPGEEATPGATPKLSKDERARKREARAERRAAKGEAGPASGDAAKAPKGGKGTRADGAPKPAKAAKAAKADRPPKAEKAEKAEKADKPTKVKRVKTRPADDDVVDNEA